MTTITDHIDDNDVWRFDLTGLSRRELVVIASALKNNPEMEAVQLQMIDALYPKDAVLSFAPMENQS